MPADRHIIAINAAQLAGHTGTAEAMLADYFAAVSPRLVSGGAHERGENCGQTPGGQQAATVPRPHFSTVTGRDFGHSISWAKAQPPGPLSSVSLRGHVAAHHARQAVPSPCSQ